MSPTLTREQALQLRAGDKVIHARHVCTVQEIEPGPSVPDDTPYPKRMDIEWKYPMFKLRCDVNPCGALHGHHGNYAGYYIGYKDLRVWEGQVSE